MEHIPEHSGPHWEHSITLISEVRMVYLVEIPFIIEDKSCSANYFPAAGQVKYSGPPLHLPLSKKFPMAEDKAVQQESYGTNPAKLI
ncbi:hypothetical protein P7K49_029601 [Saguinus oedipus]|uniref:Uncharacterized protein n=1 Tax=Saguinus oedipus TaxID=9490 RepID=A0ABQ9U7N1_SAGOE|nr:hypothetical protein P7K49_029601 [Saguinus oedipus]